MNSKLQQARKKKHWSIDEASEQIGVSRLTYIRWEQGTQIPHGSSLQMACTAFNLSEEQLGFGEVKQLSTLPFLTLSDHELLQRYDEEMLQINVGETQWKLPHVPLFDNTEGSNSTLHIQVINSSYTIPPQIAPISKDVLKKAKHLFYDSTTIRLNQLTVNGDILTLIVSKCHYFDYIGTNYAMDAIPPVGTASIRDIVHPAKKLEPLELSLLSNHIGVGCLLFTSDNYLILPLRSQEKIGIWQQQLTPSISGATNFDEDASMGLIAACLREGRDELQLENSDFAGKVPVFLGITRELLRGGKPEAFFSIHLTISRKEIEQKFKYARDRWENAELKWMKFTFLTPLTTQQEETIFLREFTQFMKQYQGSLSQPLQANLALWYKWMLQKGKYI